MALAKASEGERSEIMGDKRKSSKPIMEKRRRERINNSLNELKNLLLESRKKDSSCCSKLEKADILEMTVEHLKELRNQHEKASSSNDPVALAHYRAGFNQSAAEISRYLINAQDIEVQVRTRLLTHLSNSCHAALSAQVPVTQYSPSVVASPYCVATSQPVTNSPEASPSVLHDPLSLTFHSPPDSRPYFVNSSQLQLVPAHALANGKLAAVLVPSSDVYTGALQQFIPSQHPQPAPALSATSPDENHVDSEMISGYNSSQSSNSPDISPVWRPW